MSLVHKHIPEDINQPKSCADVHIYVLDIGESRQHEPTRSVFQKEDVVDCVTIKVNIFSIVKDVGSDKGTDPSQE